MSLYKKILLYAQIKPYDFKLSLVFSSESRIRYVQEYIEDTMRNFRAKYKVGRIEQKKASSILLPDYKIGEVLEDKDEIIVYSIEYGLTKKTLSDNSTLEDIDKLFIGKKLKRDSKNISRNDSVDKKVTKLEEEDSDDNNNNEEEEENDDDNDNDNDNDKNQKSTKNDKSKENKKENKKDKKNKEKENSSSSGDDKSQDLVI